MRQPNLELLRLFAMFLVLVVHAAFFSLGFPDSNTILSNTFEQVLITFTESISIICVNVFVLISGWFGIKPSIKSLSNFLFQVFFFLFSIYLIMIILGKTNFTLKGLLECFTITKWNWFIKVYLSLFFLSPVLNTFVVNTDKRTFKLVLITFYLLQTVYGCLGLIDHYSNGYSVISFIGLYLLARYLNVYKPVITQKTQSFYIIVYFVCAISLTTLTIVPAFLSISPNKINRLIGMLYTYICPIVIVEALSFFFIFEKMYIKTKYTKLINTLSASSFAVFLLHTNPNIILSIYVATVRYLWSLSNCITFNILAILLFLIIVFCSAILIDQIRIYFWKLCGNKIQSNLHLIVSKIIDK